MSSVWLIKLILAHLLTDFVLQPKHWIEDRMKRHFQSSRLYLHAFITAIVALLFTGIEYWQFSIIIFITHLLIDGWKSYRPQTIFYFLVDQFLHLLVIVICWNFAFNKLSDLQNAWNSLAKNDHFWAIATAYVFISFPTGIIIEYMTRKWSNQLPGAQGLVNAGKWIGILERIIILTFLLQNQYAPIGLLITAKGLLRFSEKDRQEEKTEYVLIGSLISIAFSLLTGIAVSNMIK